MKEAFEWYFKFDSKEQRKFEFQVWNPEIQIFVLFLYQFDLRNLTYKLDLYFLQILRKSFVYYSKLPFL